MTARECSRVQRAAPAVRRDQSASPHRVRETAQTPEHPTGPRSMNASSLFKRDVWLVPMLCKETKAVQLAEVRDVIVASVGCSCRHKLEPQTKSKDQLTVTLKSGKGWHAKDPQAGRALAAISLFSPVRHMTWLSWLSCVSLRGCGGRPWGAFYRTTIISHEPTAAS